MALNHDILLEVGTNEFEVVEFLIEADKKYYFGINVAKVREIIRYPDVIKLPNAHPSVIGTANIRNKVIPIINLAHWLNLKQDFNPKTAKVIITYFNHQYNGFVVDNMNRIHRVTWADIKDYSTIADFRLADSVLGVIQIDNRLIQLLDFEKIASEINPNTKMEHIEIDQSKYNLRNKKTIFLAEDSIVIRRLLKNSLLEAGYNVIDFENGNKLLHEITKKLPDLIITDLEMPEADGTFIIRTIREKMKLKELPIIVFSSLASEENERKVLSIGANNFIGKPDLGILITTIDKYLIKEGDL
ncbi:chemotaxis protein CheV [Deferribacter abyssi]|uniref:chemotaxis protein CheV n=1 Tax=Deferribacter abyssi TaxID=213806 RepID=UPI003C1DEF54